MSSVMGADRASSQGILGKEQETHQPGGFTELRFLTQVPKAGAQMVLPRLPVGTVPPREASGRCLGHARQHLLPTS